MNLGVGAWLFAHSVIPYLCLVFDVFSFVLHTRLGLLGLVFELIHYICGRPLDPTRIHLFRCSHGGEWIASHNVTRDVFTSIVRNARFHVSKLMSFCHLHFNFLVGELILCYRLMTFASWWTWSFSIPFKQIWFHMLFHLMSGDRNDCGSYIERTIYYDWHPTHAFLIFFIHVLTWHDEQKAPRSGSIDSMCLI